MDFMEVMKIICDEPHRVSEIDPDWHMGRLTTLHLVCRYNGSLAHAFTDHTGYDDHGYTPLHRLVRHFHRYTPLLKWHEVRNDRGWSPYDEIVFGGERHYHVLAKTRRLLGILPAAYIRLVHCYT